jgi:transposase
VEPILETCCGMDVHKEKVTACVVSGPLDKAEEVFEVQEFSTMTCHLRELCMWLKERNVHVVGMESTGIFWKPIFNILEEEGFHVCLANASRVKNVPGLKTDKKDARWIAKLLRYGLLPSSFIPPKDIRELRDLTRTRRKLVGELTREKNRIHKILQDANIKASSVMSDVFSVSGEKMIRTLLEKDSLTRDEIESMAKGKLKQKIDLLVKGLDGNPTDHHRFLLRKHFGHIDYLITQISDIDVEIQRRLVQHHYEFQLIQSIPGINETTAASVIAEIGVDMSRFPDEHHLSSWAAICPGNNESAGKRKSSKTRQGNNYLKATLTEAAWAASRTKDTAISEKYHNVARRRGRKRAIIAVAHQILKDVYRVMSTGEPYREVGAGTIREKTSKAREQSMVRELKRLGYVVQQIPVTA